MVKNVMCIRKNDAEGKEITDVAVERSNDIPEPTKGTLIDQANTKHVFYLMFDTCELMLHTHCCNVLWLETIQEPTVTQDTVVEKPKEITPTTTSSEVSIVTKTATTSNALAEELVSSKDVIVGDGDQLGIAGNSQNSVQAPVMQDSDGETANSAHTAAVTRLFGDPVTLSELEKFLLYAEQGSTLVGVVQLYLQPVEMGSNRKCVQPNTLEM